MSISRSSRTVEYIEFHVSPDIREGVTEAHLREAIAMAERELDPMRVKFDDDIIIIPDDPPDIIVRIRKEHRD